MAVFLQALGSVTLIVLFVGFVCWLTGDLKITVEGDE